MNGGQWTELRGGDYNSDLEHKIPFIPKNRPFVRKGLFCVKRCDTLKELYRGCSAHFFRKDVTIMRHLKRATALLCLLIAILSCFNMAALGVSTINVQKNSSAAKTKGDYMCFYFKASSTKATITFTRKKGTLTVSKNNIKDTYTIYGSYEVKLQQCDNKGNLIGSELFKQDVYNNSREKTQVTFATTKNAYYRVKVWSWNPNTVAKSYLKNNIIII